MSKKLISTILAVVMFVSCLSVNAFAAVNWMDLSTSTYLEYISPVDNIPVYKNCGLTTRGTASPSKTYQASVAEGDTLYIYNVTPTSTYISYPTASGRRLGYVSTKSLFGVTTPTEQITSSAKVNTYKLPNGVKIGSIAAGDVCYRLGTASGYYLVAYQAKSGNRGWKAAFIPKADWKKIASSSTNNTSSTTSNNTKMSYALYQSSGGKLTCGFNGYQSTNGVHEGIDFARGYGSSVYSLTDGVITRVTEGYNGSSGLSTIAVYDSSSNKTVLYLHSDPVNTLYVGQQIHKGEKIATEAWRGVSSANGTHTHVEVREGRKTAAAKSVNDHILDNKNPASYWSSLGYQVK